MRHDGATRLHGWAAWYAGFYAEHFDMTFPGTDFVARRTAVLALAVYGPRTITIPPGGSISENTLVQIVHTPQLAVPLPARRSYSSGQSWTGSLACMSSR